MQNGLKQLVAFMLGIWLGTNTFANPVVHNVGAGNISIQQTPNSTTVNQTSSKGIINWKSFNIGPNESTHFQQPKNGVTLNRIDASQGVSQIYGRLTASGQIILINPAGIYFGPSAYVNVGGLIATTASMSDHDFLNGNYRFTSNGSNGAIINDGEIIARDNGLVALVAPGVVNNGKITANLGHVVLGSGEAFTMDFSGDQLINFTITQSTSKRAVDKNGNSLRDGVANTGQILANGGKILVSAKAARGILDNVINMSGVAQAKSVSQVNGQIILSGDPSGGVVKVSGKLIASGENSGQKGGDITVTGNQILLTDTARIDASGDVGGGNIHIGGNYQGKGPLPNASGLVVANGALISADAISRGDGGNIILWADDVNKVYGDISARGGALSGDGGFVETSAKEYLEVGNILVDTSAANGKLGTWLLDPRNVDIIAGATSGGSFSGGNPNTFTPSADNAQVSAATIIANLATANVIITTGTTGTQDGDINVNAPITWTSANSLTLSANRNININAAITNTTSGLAVLNLISNNAGNFQVGGAGQVNYGVGGINVIGTTNVYYNPTSYSTPTSFASTGGTLRSFMYINTAADLQTLSNTSSLWNQNFALSTNIDARNLVGFTPIGTGPAYSGIFDGLNHTINGLTINVAGNAGLFNTVTGTLRNIGLTNINVTGTASVGGLVGVLSGGFITNSYTTGAVSGAQTGGLVGANNGSITNSYSDANVFGTGNVGGLTGYSGFVTIIDSYATGNVTGSGGIGGLIGGAQGTQIFRAFSTGTVTAGDNANYVGGLIGNCSGCSIFTSYSTSDVISGNNSANVGGFIGVDFGNTTQNSYATGSVTVGTNSTNVGGFIGRATIGFPNIVTNTYSSGAVNAGAGSTNVGGYIGVVGALTLSNSYWDQQSSGMATGVGSGPGAGLTAIATTALAKNAATYTGFSISNANFLSTWVIVEGITRPMLSWEYSTNLYTAHQLALIELNATTRSADYTLIRSFNASGTSATNAGDVWGTSTFNPISNFLGTIEGNNFAISNLTIDRPSETNVGLIAINDGTVNNLELANVSISGDVNVGGIAGQNTAAGVLNGNGVSSGTVTGNVAVGGVVGLNDGTVTRGWNFGNVTSAAAGPANLNIGGVVGHNTGTVSASYNTGTITGLASNENIGGVVGLNDAGGLFETSYNLGRIVSGINSTDVGGLIGENLGTLLNAYSMGPVVAGAGSTNVGGLAGLNSGSLQNTYSTGPTTIGGSTVGAGGLIGSNTGSVTNSYWDTEMSGNLTSAAGTARTTAQLMQPLNYVGWDFSNIWQMTAGQTYPFLRAAYNSARVVSGFLTAATSDVIGFSSINSEVNPFQDTMYIGANGFYYFLEGDNLISNQNHELLDATPFLVYSTGATKLNIASKAPVGGGNVINLDNTTANTILLSSSLGISNSDLASVRNTVTSTDILYTHSGNNITLGNVTNTTAHVVSAANTLYTINGNVSTVGGGTSSIDLAGTANISGSSVTTTGIQNYTGQVTVSAPTALTGTDITFNNGIIGGNSLTLNANNMTISGGLTLSNLVINGTGVNNNLFLDTGIAQRFNITGVDSGNIVISGLTASSFSNIQNITGGSGADTFAFTGTNMITGTIDGNLGGGNSLDYSAYTNPVNIIMNDNVVNGTATAIGVAYQNIQFFTGNGNQTTITAPNTVNNWIVNTPDTGTINGSVGFSGVGNLTGGNFADTFTLNNGATLSGAIDGGAGGGNSLIYNYTTPVSVVLNNTNADGTATGLTNGFSNIQNFTGGTNNDSITGPNLNNTWNITSNNAGNVGGVNFNSFENLIGNNGDDDFVFSTNANVVGVDGGGGNNTMDYTPATNNVTVSLGNVSNIQTILGGTGSNTLIGDDLANVWNILGTNAGNVVNSSGTINFTDFANLTGGTNTDTFVFSDGQNVTGVVNGGSGGGNTLDYSAYTTDVTITMFNNNSDGNATGTNGYLNIQNFIAGSSTNDNLTGPNTSNVWNISTTNGGSINDTDFSGFENINGGTGNDQFIFQPSGSVLNLTGGGPLNSNTLDFTQLANTIDLDLNPDLTSGVAHYGSTTTFSNISDLNGSGAGNNNINLPGNNNVVITGPAAGTINDIVDFTQFNIIHGGPGTNIAIANSLLDAFVNSITETITVNGNVIQFFNFTFPSSSTNPVDIGQIIQQGNQGGGGSLYVESPVNDDILGIISQYDAYYRDYLHSIGINLDCYGKANYSAN